MVCHRQGASLMAKVEVITPAVMSCVSQLVAGVDTEKLPRAAARMSDDGHTMLLRCMNQTHPKSLDRLQRAFPAMRPRTKARTT